MDKETELLRRISVLERTNQLQQEEINLLSRMADMFNQNIELNSKAIVCIRETIDLMLELIKKDGEKNA